MTTLYYSLLVLVTILNVMDLFYTKKFVERAGIGLEANPLARWLYGKFGVYGFVGLKVSMLALYLGVMLIAPITNILLAANLVVAFIYTWVVSRGQTIVKILS